VRNKYYSETETPVRPIELCNQPMPVETGSVDDPEPSMPARIKGLRSAPVGHSQDQLLEEQDEIIDGVEICPTSEDIDDCELDEIGETVTSNEIVPMNNEDDIRQCVDYLCMEFEALVTKDLVEDLSLKLTRACEREEPLKQEAQRLLHELLVMGQEITELSSGNAELTSWRAMDSHSIPS
jgi:hypothetical protein